MRGALSSLLHQPTRSRASLSFCQVCNSRPKYRDSYRTHPYCGKSCAAKAPDCPYAGCGSKGTRDYGGYCSQKHQNAIQFCAQCRSAPANPGQKLCSNCQMKYDQNRNRLVELPRNDSGFKEGAFSSSTDDFLYTDKRPNEAQQMLASAWPRGRPPPQVGRVFKIVLSERDQYYRVQYRSAGECSRFPVWYSAQNICELGGPTKPVEFCQYKSCGICIPLKTGFTTFEFDQKHQSGP